MEKHEALTGCQFAQRAPIGELHVLVSSIRDNKPREFISRDFNVALNIRRRSVPKNIFAKMAVMVSTPQRLRSPRTISTQPLD
jgi:hypothetical protein